VNSNENPSSNYQREKRVLLKRLIDLKLSNSQISNLILSRGDLTRILYYNQIYQLILGKPGTIMEFGVQYGLSLSLFVKLRAIYEPYNYSREIIGFDTFKGFTKNLSNYENNNDWKKGDYGVPKNFEKIIQELLNLEENNSPLNWIKKSSLVKGDASKTIKDYLKKNPHTVIGMAIFDMDVYHPTKKVLEIIKPRLFKGSILVFDELNCKSFPGETVALLESIGLNNLKLNSFHGETFGTWAIIE
tara:strand:- start:5685 stop:6419 length:735 start_codon:yes stop_codon:yes gene_type:complete